MPKIISKCCELVKLSYINCGGPVYLRHSVCVNCVNEMYDTMRYANIYSEADTNEQ